MNTARLLLVLLLSMLGGCASHAPAPVIDRSSAVTKSAHAADSAGTYVVKKGETLYGIALDFGLDYKELAAWNNLDNPNLIRAGQSLRVTSPEGSAPPVAVTRPVTSSAPVEVASKPAAGAATSPLLKHEPKGGKVVYSDAALSAARQATQSPKESAKPAVSETKPAEKIEAAVTGDAVDWAWPAGGKLLAPFAEGSSKGVDLAGKEGDPVTAAAGGVVSYAGAGLRGYGNLVVLRHNATWLSVYAHNSKILVKEKQTIAKGQKIAEIGSSDAESPRLHFEIRHQGKPVDPTKLLPAR
ncbi:MAG: peptidase M23 [Betaproteobacteria bacterium HGW-Betaproteobacteria-11]|nr:MAG: peptidase M23 [Betaproteobacteria bacterium HGW-Betaproteobacteria-11]